VIVFKKVKKTQQTSSTVTQPYYCCNIHSGYLQK